VLRRYLDVDAKLIEISNEEEKTLLQISGIMQPNKKEIRKNGLKITIRQSQ
jgi:hypothetical protein